MGIKALNLSSVDRYVSDLDPGKNAILVNKADLDAWDKSKAKEKGERPEPIYEHDPEATVWLLGTLDSVVMTALVDQVTSVSGEGGLNIKNGENDVMAARLGIRGWEKYNDDNGTPVTFKTEVGIFAGRQVDLLTDELSAAIPVPVLREIGREIKKRNSLSAVTAKNSASASSL